MRTTAEAVRVNHESHPAAPGELPIAIIGAGFAGIGMAIRLKQEGIHSFTIFERADDVGGTWRDNTYPGAACDVPSHLYSLSFEPNPGWTRRFSESQEIHAYLRGLVDKWNLRPHLRLGQEIVEARFDEDSGSWTLTTDGEETVAARVVISAVGGLVNPALPDIKGIHSFVGEMFHTARWSHDYDLAGKDVAVIGTGASAVQVIPSIAPQVRRLHVFQRTPAWVIPKHDGVYSPEQRHFYSRFPLALRASRWFLYAVTEFLGPMIFLDSKLLSRLGEWISLRHLRAQVSDPELRAKLTPNFQFGCKRVLISDDYWATFERENVELVTEPIDEIKSTGIQTKDGRLREVDAIVLATGFAVSLGAAPFDIIGRGGKKLNEVWKDGAMAYKGMTVSGFPNWFILMGPNTGPGHTSVLVYTEAQIQHALQAIRTIRDRNLRFVDIRQDVQDRYNEQIQGRMKYMSWSSGCNSWYLSPDGSNRALFPGFAGEYVLRARRFRPSEYELVAFDDARDPVGNASRERAQPRAA